MIFTFILPLLLQTKERHQEAGRYEKGNKKKISKNNSQNQKENAITNNTITHSYPYN